MIKWNDWTWETFNKSRIDAKPVLLSIHAAWCDWCRKMDLETYTDPDVEAIIARDFVPLRADPDKRPDIADRYNHDGWPTTAFLSHNGVLITASNFMNSQEMLSALSSVKKFYAGKLDEIKAAHLPSSRPEKAEIDPASSTKALDMIKTGFDVRHGGYGDQPKFPMPEMLEFLMMEHIKGNDTLWMAQKTLDSMIGLMDKKEGGFFKYAISRDWSIPDYAKILDVNAAMIENYSHAFHLTRNEIYAAVVRNVIEYAKNNLLGPQSQLFSSQHADPDYYKAQKGEKPDIEKIVLMPSACRMITALAEARIVDNSNVRLASRCMEFLISNMVAEGCVRHCYDRQAHGSFATDYIHLFGALLDMYMATAEQKYLEASEKIFSMMIGEFWHDGILDIRKDSYMIMPALQLSDNCQAAQYAMKLYTISRDADYKNYAKIMLEACSGNFMSSVPYACSYAMAVETYTNPVEVIAAGIRPIHYYDPRKSILYIDDELREKGIYVNNKKVD